MDRSHREPRRALVAAIVSVAATHSVRRRYVCEGSGGAVVKGPYCDGAGALGVGEGSDAGDAFGCAGVVFG